jgi:hypothetical protein
MIGPVANQLRLLQPKLIRIDHIYDYFNVYRGPNDFDFSGLDSAVNSILKTGAKPMLSLSYIPAGMAKNGQTGSEPSDWQQWFDLVKATANRYSVQKNISGIYYEVYNEPDLFGGWHYQKSPSYTTLYSTSAKAIASGAGNTIYKVGGPATTSYYSNWIQSLFKTAQSQNLRLDFISWHQYSKNAKDFTDNIEQLNSIIAYYPAYFDIERLITEFGPNSEPDTWYDQKLSGIHLLSMVTHLQGKVHRLFTFEAVDGPSPRSSLSSGWGLLTHPSLGAKPKPRYESLLFLNSLFGNRLYSTGDGTFVTSIAAKSGQTLKVLLVNYDPSLSHTETVPLTIKELTSGGYTFKTSYFMGKSYTKTVSVPDTVYQESIYLEPNSATILELTPTN